MNNDSTSNQQSFGRKIPVSGETHKQEVDERDKTAAGSNWQDPLNQLIFKKAFKQKITEITTRDGRRFSIEYVKRADKFNGGRMTLFAWVQIIKDREGDSRYAPCGWFNVDNYLRGS